MKPIDAYRAGWRSGISSVDTDDALDRFIRKYRPTPDIEHAWWNGFQLSQYASDGSYRDERTGRIVVKNMPLRKDPAYQHGIHCGRGICTPHGHEECEWE